MNLKFKNMNFEIELTPNFVNCLEVQNKEYFSRITLALLSQLGEVACEPYFLFNDKGKSVSVKNKLIVINTLPQIPVADKKSLSGVWDAISNDMRLDIESYDEFMSLANRMFEIIRIHSLGLHSSMDFMLEFDEKLVMKCFGFEPDSATSDKLIDNLIAFFEILIDAGSIKPVVFVNLKNFLTKNQLELVAEQAFLNKIPLLLLESSCDSNKYEREQKIVVDQDLIVFDQRGNAGCF